jgi:hypothetical protein
VKKACSPILILAFGLAAHAEAGRWTHEIVKDETTGRLERVVFGLTSANAVTVGLPYSRPRKATLYVFAENDGSVSYMVSIQAQILHGKRGRIGFDGAEPRLASLSQSTDRTPTDAFFDANRSDVVNASEIEIELTFHQQGTRVFTFTAVAPLSQHKEWAAFLEREAQVQKRLQDAKLVQEIDEILATARAACSPNSPGEERDVNATRLSVLADTHPCQVKEALTEGCVDSLRAVGAIGPTAADKLRNLRCR